MPHTVLHTPHTILPAYTLLQVPACHHTDYIPYTHPLPGHGWVPTRCCSTCTWILHTTCHTQFSSFTHLSFWVHERFALLFWVLVHILFTFQFTTTAPGSVGVTPLRCIPLPPCTFVCYRPPLPHRLDHHLRCLDSATVYSSTWDFRLVRFTVRFLSWMGSALPHAFTNTTTVHTYGLDFVCGFTGWVAYTRLHTHTATTPHHRVPAHLHTHTVLHTVLQVTWFTFCRSHVDLPRWTGSVYVTTYVTVWFGSRSRSWFYIHGCSHRFGSRFTTTLHVHTFGSTRFVTQPRSHVRFTTLVGSPAVGFTRWFTHVLGPPTTTTHVGLGSYFPLDFTMPSGSTHLSTWFVAVLHTAHVLHHTHHDLMDSLGSTTRSGLPRSTTHHTWTFGSLLVVRSRSPVHCTVPGSHATLHLRVGPPGSVQLLLYTHHHYGWTTTFLVHYRCTRFLPHGLRSLPFSHVGSHGSTSSFWFSSVHHHVPGSACVRSFTPGLHTAHVRLVTTVYGWFCTDRTRHTPPGLRARSLRSRLHHTVTACGFLHLTTVSRGSRFGFSFAFTVHVARSSVLRSDSVTVTHTFT